MMRLFEAYSESIGGPREEQVLEDIYQVMPSRNFSAHLLQEFPKHVAVMELRGVLSSIGMGPSGSPLDQREDVETSSPLSLKPGTAE